MNIKSIALSIVVAVALSACGNISYPTATRPSGVTPTSTKYVPSDTSGTSVPIVFPKIDRHPSAGDFGRGKLSALPSYNPDSGDYWQVDLRGYDLSGLDLRNSLKDLSYADFDDKTTWPPADKMPAGFDWKQIMNLGKNPGLNLQTLHGEGITGKNIGIAIIDQTLLVDHQEFADRIQLYEETADIQGASYSMHGPAVASIAVGKTVGVAPEADLYFIATAMCSQGTYESNDFACLAKSVLRIIEINRQLPSDRKIRVLSISVGWGSQSKGYAEIMAAVQKAKDAGIFIVCSSESDIYGLQFQAMGRAPLADPNKFESYEPGIWWADQFFQGYSLQNTLLVPMDSRTTASPTGVNDYVFYREGGWSWSIPYIAGVYALAAQVKPDITPDVFWSTSLQTGRTIEISHEGKQYSFGVILDPVALIHALQ
jgi:subtilisin family serine protease